MKYLVKTPWWLRSLYPSLTWHISVAEKRVFLTFDDGPCPKITEWVLEQLAAYNFKATFFLIGKNAEKFPELHRKLRESGHSTGNHTYNHLNGWKSSKKKYLKNIKDCSEVVESNLFRPPYGRIKSSQARAVSKTYRVIMWDIISGDFDTDVTAEQCAQNVINNIRPGSIIVFHDSKKAWPRLQKALPLVLEFLKNKGYDSSAIQ